MHFLRILPTILSGAFLSLGLQAAEPVNVRVYPELRRQVIRAIGGNYCQANYTAHAWDPIAEITLKEFRPSHVRVALPLKLRDTSYAAYRGRFVEQPLVGEVLAALKRMKAEFGVTHFIVSVWDVPDELIVDPAKRTQRVIKPEAYDDVIDMLVAFLRVAKERDGVAVDFFSFNESDGGYQVIFTPEETIAFIRRASQRFEDAGLATKFLWADTAKTEGTVEFATAIIAEPKIREFLGPLSFHSWWSERIPDVEFERVAALAKAWNREVWCAELGFDAMAHRTLGMNQTWDYGLRFARIFQRMIRYAEVEVSLYWTWQNNYAIMSLDGQERYPSYYVTRHHVEFLNRGTQVVHSTTSDGDVLPVSGIRPDGSRVVHVLNLKTTPVELRLEGIATTAAVEKITTRETNLWDARMEPAPSASTAGVVKTELPAQSLTTLILR